MASDDDTEYKPVKMANGRTVLSRKTRQQKQKSKEKNEQSSEGAGSDEPGDEENQDEDSKSTTAQSHKSSKNSEKADEEDDNNQEDSASKKAGSQKSSQYTGSQRSSQRDDPRTARQKIQDQAPLVYLGGPPSSAGGKPRSERNRYVDNIANDARQAGYYPDIRYSSGGPVMALGRNSDDIAPDTKLAYAKYLGRQARGAGYDPYVFRSTKNLNDDGQSQYTVRVTTIGDEDDLEERLIQQEQSLQDQEAKLAKCRRAADQARQQAQDLADELQRQESATNAERKRRDSLLAKHMDQSREKVARRAAQTARQRRNKMQDYQDGDGQRNGSRYGGGDSNTSRGRGSGGGSRASGGGGGSRASGGGGSGSQYSQGSQSRYSQSQY